MFVGAVIPLDERDELYGAGGEQGVGGHRVKPEIVIDICVEQRIETADERCITADARL